MDERTQRFWELVGRIDNERHAQWANAFWDSFSAMFNPNEIPASCTIAGRWPRHPYDMAVERLKGFLSGFTFVFENCERAWSGEGVPGDIQPFIRKLIAPAVRASVSEDCTVDVEGLFGDGNVRARLLTNAGGVEAVLALAKHFSSTIENWNARDWEAFEDSVRGGVNADQDESQHAFARLLLDKLRNLVRQDSTLTIPDFFDLLLLQRFDPARYTRWGKDEQTAFPTGLFRDPLEMASNVVTFVCAQKDLEGFEGLEDPEERLSKAREYVEEWVEEGIKGLKDSVKAIACEVKEASLGIAIDAIRLTEETLLHIPSVSRIVRDEPERDRSWDDVLFLLTLACCVGSRREDALRYCEKRFGRIAPRTGEFYAHSEGKPEEAFAPQDNGCASMSVLLKTDGDGRTSGVFALYGRTQKGGITTRSRSFFFKDGNDSTRFMAGSSINVRLFKTGSEITANVRSENKPLTAVIAGEGGVEDEGNIEFHSNEGRWGANWDCLGTLLFFTENHGCIDGSGMRLIESERPTHLIVFSQSADQFYDIPFDDLKSRRLAIAGAHAGNRLYTRPFLDYSGGGHPDAWFGDEGLFDIPEDERLVRIDRDEAEESGCHVLYVDDGNVARLNADRPEPDGGLGGQCSVLWTAKRGWILTQISNRSFTVVSRGRDCYFPGADGIELEIGDLIRFVPGILVVNHLLGRDAAELADSEEIARILSSVGQKELEDACVAVVRSADDPFSEDQVDLCGVRWGWRS